MLRFSTEKNATRPAMDNDRGRGAQYARIRGVLDPAAELPERRERFPVGEAVIDRVTLAVILSLDSVQTADNEKLLKKKTLATNQSRMQKSKVLNEKNARKKDSKI
jgi:hypothetical protein